MLKFTHDEMFRLRKAVMFARDAAFLNVGDKNHAAVKDWEALARRIEDVDATLDEVQP
jgi:hypothetical protein